MFARRKTVKILNIMGKNKTFDHFRFDDKIKYVAVNDVYCCQIWMPNETFDAIINFMHNEYIFFYYCSIHSLRHI